MSDEQVRREFEKWLLDVHWLEATWNIERNCYDEFPAHLAFKAWQVQQAEIDRLTSELEAVRKDCLTLAMRLYGESEDTFAPETADVMARKRIEIEKYMEGK